LSKFLEPADLDGGRKTVKIAWVERGLNAMDVVTSDGKRIEIDGRLMGTLTPMLGTDMSKWTGRELVVEADASLRGGLHATAKPEERPRSSHSGVVVIDPDERAKASGRISNWINSSFNK
jgi:hypothetical protein